MNILDIEDVERQISDLRRQQVIEEHFYINDVFRAPENNAEYCLEEFVLPAGRTLDFAASFSSGAGK